MESLSVSFDSDGNMIQMDLNGGISVVATDEDAARSQIQLIHGGDFQFKIHPNINQDLFLKEGVLTLKDTTKPFPLNTPVNVLKWRVRGRGEEDVPLRIACWPTVGVGGHTVITLEYSLGQKYYTTHSLNDVVISLPIVYVSSLSLSLLSPFIHWLIFPRAKGTPNAATEEGCYVFFSKTSHLEWQIPCISVENPNGTLEIQLQQWEDNTDDTSWLFPIHCTFFSHEIMSLVKIGNTINQMNGESVKYATVKEFKVDRFVIGGGVEK